MCNSFTVDGSILRKVGRKPKSMVSTANLEVEASFVPNVTQRGECYRKVLRE